ncbi:MAG: nitroreductase [Pseudomonadota bacterium]
MDALVALQTRTSAPRLTEPAPNQAQLDEILKAALRAPDHGMLRPWKYLIIEGEGRNKLAQMFVDQMKPENEERKQKLLTTPMRAPMIIVAVAAIKEGKKPIEQVCSVAAAIQNMSVAIHALGFGSIWLTGGPASHAGVKAALGLKESDEIVGYLYVGTPTFTDRPVPQHNLSDFVQRWPV